MDAVAAATRLSGIGLNRKKKCFVLIYGATPSMSPLTKRFNTLGRNKIIPAIAIPVNDVPLKLIPIVITAMTSKEQSNKEKSRRKVYATEKTGASN